MNDGEVEGGGARVSEEAKENRAGGGRGGSHLSFATPVLHVARISGLLYATRRGTMFHRETEGRRSRRRMEKHEEEKEEDEDEEEEEEEEVALARRGVTVAYVNHIEARTI